MTFSGVGVDLYEYQAKELFAAHDVPTILGAVVTDAQAAKAAAEKVGKASRRQGAGEGRWPR